MENRNNSLLNKLHNL